MTELHFPPVQYFEISSMPILRPGSGYLGNPTNEATKMWVTDDRNVSNIRRTLVGNEFVDHSDVVGASPVGASPTTSEWST